MPNKLRNLYTATEDKESGLFFEKNVDIVLSFSDDPIRANVYRPLNTLQGEKVPVLVTYGPYGKDIHYHDFHEKSYSEVDPAQKTKYSCWETPEPIYWTSHGYAVVRADEKGLGQSPGILDVMSKSTSQCFAEVVEWAASQPWSSGKVGLLGVSYYAGSQWRVAARRPKGLAAIIPWEGMADYYRDRCRHGGIFANSFIKFWWNRQIITNQYGRPGRAAAKWGEDTIEGDLLEEELKKNVRDQNVDNENNCYLDDEYYASKDYKLEDINVPLLSVANWGTLSLHLRGNVLGYMFAGSKTKFLRFILGRHDLPFYYPECVELQTSFFEAFLKGNDSGGWISGKQPAVDITLRKGDVGFDNPPAEKTLPHRSENEWPIARTQYTKYYLTVDGGLTPDKTPQPRKALPYAGLGSEDKLDNKLKFSTHPLEAETEITGHSVAHLNVSVDRGDEPLPETLDIDIFLTLRLYSPGGKEILYTAGGGAGGPITKGWLRVSLRKVNESHPRHRPYMPHRDYLSTSVQPVKNREVYTADVELWPTNVVVEKGATLTLELASSDIDSHPLLRHNNPVDRPVEKFGGIYNLHFGPETGNYVTFPIIPPK